jgi:hypothetical protein
LAYLLVDIKQKAARHNSQPGGRAAYSTPKLKVFGPVGTLTQAGTGTRSEGGMGMGMSGKKRP